MIAYHGSSHNFRVLRIRKDLARNSTKENEGYGIYFSLQKDIACSYGQYLYTLQISDNYLVDMRIRQTRMAYIQKLRNELKQVFGFCLERYIDLRSLEQYLGAGSIAIVGLNREVKLLLDSNERFYVDFRKRSGRVIDWLDKWNGAPRAYLFPYHIKDCGIVRDLSPEVVQIIDKERIVRG